MRRITIRCRRDGPDGPRPELKRWASFASIELDNDLRVLEMFDRSAMEHAVDLQVRSYELLRWLSSALRRGFISFGDAHTYSSLPVAAEEWIEKHYLDIPPLARPKKEDVREFCVLFSTYLQNSFELVRNPGMRLQSHHHNCFCPRCSWLVEAPNLRTKKPTAADKKRARKLLIAELVGIAAEHHVTVTDSSLAAIVDDAHLGRLAAQCAYGRDLLNRLRGEAIGSATLVLWRRFAWLPSGSPDKNFKLTSEGIISAQFELRDHILGEKTPNHSLKADRPDGRRP